MSDIVMRGSTRHTVEYVKYPRLDVSLVTHTAKNQSTSKSTNPTLPPRSDRTKILSSGARQLSQLNVNTQCLRSFSTGTISHDHTLSSDRVG
jgi:hypothetical protein